jgi:hypothetical protein
MGGIVRIKVKVSLLEASSTFDAMNKQVTAIICELG